MSDQILAASAAALRLPGAIASKLLTAESETTSRFFSIIGREQAYIAGITADRNLGGWFGAFHRAVTTSDPFEIEIERARRVASAAFHGIALVQESKRAADLANRVDTLNAARRLAGLSEINPRTILPKPGAALTSLNRVATGDDHFDVEQAAITVSRDVAIATAVAAGSFAGSALAGLFARGATTAATSSFAVQAGQEALMGGAIAGTAATARAIDDVERRAKTPAQAALDVTRSTLWGAAFGGLFGGLLHGFRAYLSSIRPGAAQRPQQTGGTLPKPKTALNDSPEPNTEPSGHPRMLQDPQAIRR